MIRTLLFCLFFLCLRNNKKINKFKKKEHKSNRLTGRPKATFLLWAIWRNHSINNEHEKLRMSQSSNNFWQRFDISLPSSSFPPEAAFEGGSEYFNENF